jgi:hypothetical protein
VWIQTNEVRDTEGTAVPAGRLGQFNINVPHAIYFASMETNPAWTLDSQWQYGRPQYSSSAGPTSGFTGTNIIGFNLSGNYPNRLSLSYATTPAIDCSGFTGIALRFRRWLGLRSSDTAVLQVSTNGTAWTVVWSTSSAISDSTWQEVQYLLPAWTAGSRTLRVRWGLASNSSQNDIGWNIDDVVIFGNGSLDTSPPVPVINIGNIVDASAAPHLFAVTFTDDSAVRVASLGSSNLLLTGPNGYSSAVDYLGVNLPSDGTPRVAIYSARAPGGTWDVADNGSYQIRLLSGQVTDTSNNAVPESVLGSFTVAVASNTPPLVTITSPTNGTKLFAPASFLLQASASDSDGQVVQVGFLQATNYLGGSTASPFTMGVSNLLEGSYIFSAVATDNAGGKATNTIHLDVLGVSPVRMVNPVWAGTDFIFSFASQAGIAYDIRYSDVLDGSNWLSLGTIAGDGSMLSVTNRGPDSAMRFYRIQAR